MSDRIPVAQCSGGLVQDIEALEHSTAQVAHVVPDVFEEHLAQSIEFAGVEHVHHPLGGVFAHYDVDAGKPATHVIDLLAEHRDRNTVQSKVACHGHHQQRVAER